MSKAEQVREVIRAVKNDGLEQDVAINVAITIVVNEVGMSKSLAKTYVSNNWDKVKEKVVANTEANNDKPKLISKGVNNLNTGAGNALGQYSAEYQSYGTRKLAHYNEWLLNHELGENYPGFPEDVELMKNG